MKIFVRNEQDVIQCIRLKKGPRQMISVASRLYRVDDKYMVKDKKSSDCIIVYDIDETQPYGPVPQFVDPDMTRQLISSAKIQRNKKSIWQNLTGSHIQDYLIGIVIIGQIAYGFLIKGGF